MVTQSPPPTPFSCLFQSFSSSCAHEALNVGANKLRSNSAKRNCCILAQWFLWFGSLCTNTGTTQGRRKSRFVSGSGLNRSTMVLCLFKQVCLRHQTSDLGICTTESTTAVPEQCLHTCCPYSEQSYPYHFKPKFSSDWSLNSYADFVENEDPHLGAFTLYQVRQEFCQPEIVTWQLLEEIVYTFLVSVLKLLFSAHR